MNVYVPFERIDEIKEEYIELLFLEAAKTRMDMKDKILSGKLLQKYS